MNYYCKTSRLKEIFLGDLDGGRFLSEQYLPSAQRLAELYSASRNTIRRMLGELEADNVLQRESNRRFLAENQKNLDSGGNGRGGLHTTDEKKRPVIGWFYSGSRDSLIAARTHGIERFSEENNLELCIITSHHGHEPLLDLLENIQSCGIDGVLVANHPLPRYTNALNHLVDVHFPVVVACGQSDLCRASTVAEDDFHGIHAASLCLIEKLNGSVYFLGGTGNIDARLKAFQQALCNTGFVRESDTHIRILELEMDTPQNWDMCQKMLLPGKLIRPFLSSLKMPTGIVCANDYIAYGVYEAAQELGIKIGKELQVTGFSDLPFAARLTPPLTTVHVDYEKLGYQAAWLLYQLITGKISKPTNLLISAVLVKRGSCIS